MQRAADKIFDPLQRAWLNIYWDDFGVAPVMNVRQAQARQSLGKLSAAETALLERATVLAEHIRATLRKPDRHREANVAGVKSRVQGRAARAAKALARTRTLNGRQ